ncbi:MAG: helical backbone metal receptor [Streptosporangiaceae bacterium]
MSADPSSPPALRASGGGPFAAHPERYPRIGLDRLRAAGANLVALPDEPYRFTAGDGPEAFPGMATTLVSGRHLT